MNIQQIADDIFYVGVNDRVKHKFEALWPLPYGVSYNSYIVAGSDKVALIDTVCVEEVREYFNKLKDLAADRKIDYLVVNHMEPDHSGSIPEIVLAYPEIKIVGNSKTIDMIRGFYHFDGPDRFLTVKEGDTIELGGKTLRFFMTPMVHWPETMMTYVEEQQVLFSGDAFGTFGALNGAVLDRDMETSEYISEMYRYYSNIVGKYGRFVQNAIAKLADVKLAMICPTHGPVWTDMIPQVVRIVSDLAAYRSERGVVIVYGSMYGNTASAADALAGALAVRGVKKIAVYDVSNAHVSELISEIFRASHLVFAAPTYNAGIYPVMENLLSDMKALAVQKKTVAVMENGTWAPTAAKQVKEKISEMKDMTILDTGLTIKSAMHADQKAELDALADAIVNSMV